MDHIICTMKGYIQQVFLWIKFCCIGVIDMFILALEEEARCKQYNKIIQKDTAVERTFEWVHTQVRSGVMQEVANQREERVSSGESQLPYLDRRVLEGGRTQLVVGHTDNIV